ncbi:MAG: hypothetical protein K2L88_00900 [Clostridiales bacterium]|nr:hypothetical protein [Clostridiales bacterium]
MPIVLGIAFMVIGSFADNETMYHVGVWILTAGIPIVMFVLVVIGLILMITGKIDISDDKKRDADKKQDEQSEWEEVEDEDDNKDKAEIKKPQSVKQDEQSEWIEVDDEDEDKEQSEREMEYRDLAAINTSHGRANRDKNAEDIIRHAANNYRNAPKKDKILGWMFFGFLMTGFALIIVFFMLDIFVGAIVCFCIFGGTILIALLVTVLRQKISMGFGVSKKKKRDALYGRVTSCDVASTTKVNNRITKVVYQVIIVDGENEYNAYTESFYETGDKVKFCKIGKRLVSIVDEEFEDDEPLD